MSSLSTREATEKLIQIVEGMNTDDLLDFHNELFPQERKLELSHTDAGASDRRKILEYIHDGLEIEELLDLWNVAFPGSQDLSYDEETQTIQYSELIKTF